MCSEQARNVRLQLGEPILRPEDVHRVEVGTTVDDLGNHRQHGIRLLGEEIAEFDESFCHPWTLVQQRTGVQERLQRRRCGQREAVDDQLPGGEVSCRHLLVREEVEFGKIR